MLRWPWRSLCVLALLCCASLARADAFDVAELRDSQSLTPFVRWYQSDGSLADARLAYAAGKFQALTRPVPDFGFTTEAYWLAFEVRDDLDRAWILRLSYPLIDELTLYRVLPGGAVQRVETGDMRPFDTRARPSLDFTFEEHGTMQYFVRARTQGALRLPVSAWRPEALLERERHDELISLAFLGALAALALYNLGVYWLIKQLEHLIFVGVVAAELVALTSFHGQLAPLFPHQPALVNQALPVSLASCLLLFCAFAVVVLGRVEQLARETLWVRRVIPAAALLLAFTLVGSVGLATRAAVGSCVLVTIGGMLLFAKLQRQRVPGIKLHVRGWLLLVIALAIQAGASELMLPSSFVTEWGSHIGCSLQGILLSLALAQQLNLIKERLASNVTELEQALVRAEQATRVKDEFVATMSHELRTPLNAIINIPLALLEKFASVPGASCRACHDEFALDDGERLSASSPCPSCGQPQLAPHVVTQFVGDPNEAQHYLALAERCGKHLLQMVNGVLDCSKIAAGKFELQLAPCDPMLLLREAAESMQEAAAQKNVRLVFDLPYETPQLATLDELRIRQVLFNLLSNAIKFSSAGGAVTISAHSYEHELEVAVHDQGIGIASEHQERIFDGFEQVHRGDNRKYGGSGLGLSISRSLVRMHGGELWVESQLDRGATFRFRLPRDPSLKAANDNLAAARAS